MAEPEQKAETSVSPATKKDRSPSFPFITLSKSIERTKALFEQAKRHEMRMADAAKAMGYGAKSSGVIQTLAALIAFGLVEDSGSGESRKFRVSDLGFKALADQRPGAREAAMAEAALKPKLISEYAVTWKDGRPNDAICLSELHIDRGFTADGAKTFLRVFDDAITFSKVGDSDKASDAGNEFDALLEPSNQVISAGDWVRVETGGQIVFDKTRVRAIDGQWVFVEASQSGAKMSDVILIEKASHVAEAPPTLPFATSQDVKIEAGEEMDRFTVDEGVVKIAFPAGMSADSLDDLDAFFKLFIKKAKRRAGVDQKSS